MLNHGSYKTDLFIAFVSRLGIYLGILSILILVSFGCSPRFDTTLPKLEVGAAPTELQSGDASMTRNRLPQGGCDEKSDSSLIEPLGRYPKAQP